MIQSARPFIPFNIQIFLISQIIWIRLFDFDN